MNPKKTSFVRGKDNTMTVGELRRRMAKGNMNTIESDPFKVVKISSSWDLPGDDIRAAIDAARAGIHAASHFLDTFYKEKLKQLEATIAASQQSRSKAPASTSPNKPSESTRRGKCTRRPSSASAAQKLSREQSRTGSPSSRKTAGAGKRILKP